MTTDRKKWAAIGGALVIVAAVALTYLLLSQRQPKDAPDVQLSLLDGSKPMLSAYRGKNVLGVFWSVSCAICAEEIPHLNELYRQRDRYNLEIIGFNMPYDRPDWTVSFVKTRAMQYPVSLDVRGEIARGFGGVHGTPTTVLIDKHGHIIWKRIGRTDFDKLKTQLDELNKGA